MRRRSHQHRKGPEEINITAFMNLMVILVPFLLITAVFSRMVILELHIPTSSDPSENDEPPGLQLEVTIRKDMLEVSDRKGGLIKRIENTADGYNFRELSKVLQQIKTRFPDTLESNLLAEPEISYEHLIRLMDTVRVANVVKSASVVQIELFPNIAIGDAPPTSTPAEK